MAEFELPGMHVLQFAFGGENPSANTAIPHAHGRNSVVYTGTHDNAPTKYWFDNCGEDERRNLARYACAQAEREGVVRLLARLAFASHADLAVLPMQDVLELGAEGRMNTPGIAEGNWGWRMTEEQALPERLAWVTELAEVYGRLFAGAPEPAPEPEY